MRAAEGYVELGMPLEANEELEQIEPDVRHVPEVLALRLQIYPTLEKWELRQAVSSKLAAMKADCDLAGKGSEAEVNDALAELLVRVSALSSAWISPSS